MAKLWKMANGLATDDVAVLIAMHWGDLKVDDGFFLFSFFCCIWQVFLKCCIWQVEVTHGCSV